jgi:hypothetical protein
MSAQHTPVAPVGYLCERVALVRLRDDVDSLPLHAHKRKVVRDWIEEHMAKVEQDARAAIAKATGAQQ